MEYQERTVFVNQWSTVTKKRQVTKYKNETKTRTVTLNRMIPTKEKRVRTVVVNRMVPKTRVESYRVAVPYAEEVQQEYLLL